jgi:ankyrin repeat protein
MRAFMHAATEVDVWEASKDGDVAALRGLNVLERDVRGKTTLHYAASAGQKEAVVYLLGAAPELLLAQTNDGETALHLASWNGRDKCVKALLKANRAV